MAPASICIKAVEKWPSILQRAWIFRVSELFMCWYLSLPNYFIVSIRTMKLLASLWMKMAWVEVLHWNQRIPQTKYQKEKTPLNCCKMATRCKCAIKVFVHQKVAYAFSKNNRTKTLLPLLNSKGAFHFAIGDIHTHIKKSIIFCCMLKVPNWNWRWFNRVCLLVTIIWLLFINLWMPKRKST